MGAFIRKRSSKIRIITDLSWPKDASINDYIPKDQFTLQYIKFDDIVCKVKECGYLSYMAKIDLEAAFKHILVKRDQWELLGFTVKYKYDNVEKLLYYMCNTLPFGLRSSPKLFDLYAEGLEYIFYKNGVSYVCHYLDDSLTVSDNIVMCRKNLDIMLKTCRDLGLSIQPKKLVKPSTCVEMLGIVIDTKLMQLRISKERLSCIKEEIVSWSTKKWCTKRQLLSIIGKLEFISKVVRHGRSFVRRLIELSKKVKQLHYKIRLNRSALSHIKWWNNFLPYYHGVSIIYDDKWTSTDSLHMWTDAADHGIGCVFSNLYIYEQFSDSLKQKPIVWRELYAIVVACASWGHHFVGKRLLFSCDNEAIVYCLNSGVSKNVELMTLQRKLLFIGACHNFEFSAVYIRSKSNVLADALSRGDLERFFRNCKSANIMQRCNSVDIMCDLYNYR
jgi:hypothetical protein